MTEPKELKELQELIDAFVAYRDVLTPLQENLRSVVDAYGGIRADVERLDRTFSGETKAQLEKIYASLSTQAKSSRELTEKIDEFSKSGVRYGQAVSDMTEKFSAIEQRLKSIDEMERAAEEQLARLDKIVNEKKVSYNVKDLQKSLEKYNQNVERVSEFINRDVAAVLTENGKRIEEIRRENEAMSAALAEQNKTVKELIHAFRETTETLRNTVEGERVNEEYIFTILDKWAASRKVKVKK
ncbi:MAG: hypothetical protein IJ735_08005 [Clostridia bacterium]|nr:hypothetical protein [Clostridia bacterium]